MLLRRGYHKNQAQMTQHLDTIHSSGKHLLELINDILDLSKVEAGRMEVERINCAPHAIIREVVEILARARAGEGHRGCASMRSAGARDGAHRPGPPAADRDQPRRQRASSSPRKAASTVVLACVPAPARRMLGIDVVDTGIGIPADRLEAVFEPFTQADSSITRRFGGTGLGLTISRQFARALGGDIVAHSEMGKGSVFSVTLDPGPLEGVRMLAPEEAKAGEIDSGPAEGVSLAVPARARVGGRRRRGQPRAGPACAGGGRLERGARPRTARSAWTWPTASAST